MRRNRAREAPADDIPLLTEEVEVAAQEGAANGTRPGRAALPSSRRPEAADDVPELTDAVAYVDAVSIQPLAEEGGEVSRWLESEFGEASITGPAPDSIAVVPPATLRPAAETTPVIPEPVALDAGAAHAPTPMPATAPRERGRGARRESLRRGSPTAGPADERLCVRSDARDLAGFAAARRSGIRRGTPRSFRRRCRWRHAAAACRFHPPSSQNPRRSRLWPLRSPPTMPRAGRRLQRRSECKSCSGSTSSRTRDCSSS